MAELLAVGSTALTSSDFTVAAGASLLVHLKPASGEDVPFGVTVLLQIKAGTSYITMYHLTAREPGRIVQGGSATVTYRLKRLASPYAVGADSV